MSWAGEIISIAVTIGGIVAAIYALDWLQRHAEDAELEARIAHQRALAAEAVGDFPAIHEEMKAATRQKLGGRGSCNDGQRPRVRTSHIAHDNRAPKP